MVNIAIVGAGFSGLALCWHLLQYPHVQVTVFDQHEIGSSTSGVSAGLLHPYTGVQAKRNWMAPECMAETTSLLRIASQAVGTPVAEFTGILRPTKTEFQRESFLAAARCYEDLQWWNAAMCAAKVKGLRQCEGLFIPTGVTVNSFKYLLGLWAACSVKGAKLIIQKIDALDALTKFDAVIVAAGALTEQLLGIPLPLSLIKGQVIELSWPKGLPFAPFSIIADAYLVMCPENQSCLVGATYERNYASLLPEPEIALHLLKTKATSLFPELADSHLISCKAGVRASTKGTRKPLVGPIAAHPNCWAFTGMGSKGLLYHAWLAKLCSRAILQDSPEILPKEVRINR
jgi:glycine/D-amino acid oxidase-like deaminating enzyme